MKADKEWAALAARTVLGSRLHWCCRPLGGSMVVLEDEHQLGQISCALCTGPYKDKHGGGEPTSLQHGTVL
ncbi:hypothetical protein HaLaN_32615, partial [Haematococcus lacustris]